MAVPKATLPLSDFSPLRKICCSLVNAWLPKPVAPPGSRLLMSARFISWTWSRAVLSMVRDVVAELPSSLAVTTAPSRARLSGLRDILKLVMSLLMMISFDQVA